MTKLWSSLAAQQLVVWRVERALIKTRHRWTRKLPNTRKQLQPAGLNYGWMRLYDSIVHEISQPFPAKSQIWKIVHRRLWSRWDAGIKSCSMKAEKNRRMFHSENMILQERKASALCTTVQTSLKRKAITSMKTLTVTNDTAQGVEREQEAHGAGVKSLLSP